MAGSHKHGIVLASETLNSMTEQSSVEMDKNYILKAFLMDIVGKVGSVKSICGLPSLYI